MDQDKDKKQNTQNPQDPNRQGQQQDPSRQGQQHESGQGDQYKKDQDQRRQPGSNPENEGQKDRKSA